MCLCCPIISLVSSAGISMYPGNSWMLVYVWHQLFQHTGVSLYGEGEDRQGMRCTFACLVSVLYIEKYRVVQFACKCMHVRWSMYVQCTYPTYSDHASPPLPPVPSLIHTYPTCLCLKCDGSKWGVPQTQTGEVLKLKNDLVNFYYCLI